MLFASIMNEHINLEYCFDPIRHISMKLLEELNRIIFLIEAKNTHFKTHSFRNFSIFIKIFPSPMALFGIPLRLIYILKILMLPVSRYIFYILLSFTFDSDF